MKPLSGVCSIGVTLGRARYFGLVPVVSQTVRGADKSPNQTSGVLVNTYRRSDAG